MRYITFIELLMRHKKVFEDFSELHNMGFDLYEGKYQITSHVDGMFTIILEEHYTQEGVDWVNWFIYENEYGQKDWSKLPLYDEKGNEIHKAGEVRFGATDENGDPICYSYESLWKHVEKNHKKK